MEAGNTIHNLQYDLESMKRKISGLEVRAQEANELNEKVYQYEVRMKEMNVKIQGLMRDQEMAESVHEDNEKLKRKVNELAEIANRINDYEYKIEMVTKEIDRLNIIVETKNRELHEKQQEGENLARQFNQVREDFRKITGENRDLHSQLQEGQEKLRISAAQTSKLM